MLSQKKNKKRICYVVCYKEPNYIRTQVLVSALKKMDSIELIEVRNNERGLLRYLEVPLKVFLVRITKKPDTFIVGFRANEIFWALFPSMAGKRIIFDEFVVLHDWLVSEHGKLRDNGFIIKLIDGYMKWLIGRCSVILTDTRAHADLIKRVYGVNESKIITIPVGTDESVFYPRPPISHQNFDIFFYGSMLPLHGMETILEAILICTAKTNKVKFTIAGGRGNRVMMDRITEFISSNNLSEQMKHIDWIEYTKLPDFIATADLCLAGPFGDTGQSKRVITGKTFQFLAMGRPTIIGQNEVTKSFIDKKNCLLIKQKSPADLADAILWSLNNKDEIKIMGQNGRKLFEENFSLKYITDKLEPVLGPSRA